MSVTKQKRRQLELRVIGHNTEDVQEALESIIANCYPSAYYSQVKEYDHEEFRFRAYISIVLNDKEDSKSAARQDGEER